MIAEANTLNHEHQVELVELVPDRNGCFNEKIFQYTSELERNNNRDFVIVIFLWEKGSIRENEKESLLRMVDSVDPENYVIVKEILKTKTNELAKMRAM